MKLTDKQIEKYLELTRFIKQKESELRELKDWIKKNNGYESKNYKAKVSVYEREYLKINGVIEKFGRRALGRLLTRSEATKITVTKKQA